MYGVHERDGVRRFLNVFSVAGFLLHCIHSSWVGDERDQILVYKLENLPLQTSLNGCLERFLELGINVNFVKGPKKKQDVKSHNQLYSAI